jgi:hypothetical protein
MSRVARGSASRRAISAATLAVTAGCTGCVERWLVVRPDPPVAEVFVDGRDVGQTSGPDGVRVPFDFYGTRTIVVRAKGHVPVRRQVTLDPPWWQFPPIDLVTDLLWPGTIEDVHTVDVKLVPRGPLEDPAALERRARDASRSEERRP